MITAEQVEENINPPDFYHSPLTTLVCLENTTNKGGGACYDFEEMRKIREVCDRHGLGLHLDGARLFNAIVAKNEDPKEYGKIFDTISVCLSKGLGTPIGTVLIGDRDIMKGAMRVRKVLGGGMRQIGFMAAAGIYALDNHVERLAEDNKRASELGKTLKELDYVGEVEPVETNIVDLLFKRCQRMKPLYGAVKAAKYQDKQYGTGKTKISNPPGLFRRNASTVFGSA
jgi:threonine aldolase